MSCLFAYDINSDVKRNIKEMQGAIDEELSILKTRLNELTGLTFYHISEYYGGPEIVLRVSADEEPEWTQFSFRFCNNLHAIEILHLHLPERMQRKGIGTYCVNWIKDYCEKHGLDYIVLGSYDWSAGFWSKMGFTNITGDNKALEKYSRRDGRNLNINNIGQKKIDKSLKGLLKHFSKKMKRKNKNI